MDYDRIEADYKSLLADLEAARQDLAYASIMAPFAGEIARRHVENFEQVLANQSVFTLQDIATLEVKVDIPERLIRRLPRLGQAGVADSSQVSQMTAYFSGNPQTRYPPSLKEVATKADASTQTFESTFSMASPEGITVLPGMTVSVRAEPASMMPGDGFFLIPASAIAGSPSLDSRVWVVDEESLTVHARPVTLGELEGDRIQVLDGLRTHERIVAAGIGALSEGMKVTLMQGGEQAEPRDSTRAAK